MTRFIEPLATQQLWYWLESSQGWRVDSEVETGNGRIDLACKTPEERRVGIELKRGSGLSEGSRLPRQIGRYIDSGLFDEVYFASPTVEDAADQLQDSSPNPLPGVVRKATRRLQAGVHQGYYDPETALSQIERECGSILAETIWGGRSIREFISRSLRVKEDPAVSPVTLEEGVRILSRSVLPKELGLIRVPLRFEDGVLLNPEEALTPGEISEPGFVREAGSLPRGSASTLEFSSREEPRIRHAVWRKFGGIPEGTVPNVMESDQVDRPIDLISFEGSPDPTEICQNRQTGEVIGVEVKGEGSYSPSRVEVQLTEYLESQVFSRLYLAVPSEVGARAGNFVADHPDLHDKVGVIEVARDGRVMRVREAPELDLNFDGYKSKNGVCKTGYGDVRIQNGRDVSSPFLLSEWRAPLKDSDGKPVFWNYDPRETGRVVKDREELDLADHVETDRPLKVEAQEARPARAYLLTGYSADPYAEREQGSEQERRSPKHGYVRLTVTGFEKEGEQGIDLHFGRGSWEGGYVCFWGNQVDSLVSVLSSLEHIEGAKVPGQGDYINLQTFPFSYHKNYKQKLSADSDGSEQHLHLGIEANRSQGDVGAILRVAESRHSGVEVKMTETQRIDILRTIRIVRFGRGTEIPGKGGGYQRIGPDGADTWDLGTEIEEKHDPVRLENPFRTEEKGLIEKWARLREKAEKRAEEQKWGLHSNARLEVADFLKQEGRTHRALSVYLEVAMLDVNGPMNHGVFEAEHDWGVPPAVSHYILECAGKIGLGMEDLKQEYQTVAREKWKSGFGLTREQTWKKIKKGLTEKIGGTGRTYDLGE